MSNFKVDNLECNTINGAPLGASGGGSIPTFTEYHTDNSGTIEGSEINDGNTILFEKDYNTTYSDILQDYTPDFTEIVTFIGTFNISNGIGTYAGLFGIMDEENNSGIQFLISNNNKIMGYIDSWDTATYSEPIDPNVDHTIKIKVNMKTQIVNMTLDDNIVTEFDNKLISYTDFSLSTATRAEIGHPSHKFDSLISSIKFEKSGPKIVTINQESTDTNFTKVTVTSKNLDGTLSINGTERLTGEGVENSSSTKTHFNDNGDIISSTDKTHKFKINVSRQLMNNATLKSVEYTTSFGHEFNLVLVEQTDQNSKTYKTIKISEPFSHTGSGAEEFDFNFDIPSEGTFFIGISDITNAKEMYIAGEIRHSKSAAVVAEGDSNTFVEYTNGAPVVEFTYGPSIPTETTTFITDVNSLEFSVDGTVDSINYQTYTSTEIDAIGLVGQAVDVIADKANIEDEIITKLRNLL